MQIKVFTIPMIGGEQMNEELNNFLRSRKVIHVDRQLVSNAQDAYWSFCVQYLDGAPTFSKDKRKRDKPDYKQLLDEASFSRFSKMREIRKQLAKEEALPAYAIFTDAELVELAKIEGLSLNKMQVVKGVGKKKVEKYGQHFLSNSEKDEKG